MKKVANLVLAMLFTTLACHVAAESQENVLRKALEDEMARSLQTLQLENESKPYFISYTVTEVNSVSANATLGALLTSNSNRSRILDVQVRVGSPELDNTNYSGSSGPFNFDLGGLMGGGPSFPITDSYDEIRRVAWLATDSAYKNAVSNLAGKKAALEQQNIEDRPNDFSEEEAFVYSSTEHYPVSDVELVSKLAIDLSISLSGMPDILDSSATVNSVTTKRLFLDSQGNSHDIEMGVCSVATKARTQTEEGIQIRGNSSAYARTCDELEDRRLSMKEEIVLMANDLMFMRGAETLECYSGPVLFEPQAAAQLLSQALTGRLAASPKPITEASGFSLPTTENPFQDRIDSRVFPRSMSVVNDPTTKEFNGQSLLGGYVVDAEGMPSRRTELISNGILRALLSTRAPTKATSTSTGSNRVGIGGAVPGNLFIESSDGASMDELRSELLTLAEENGQEYAIVVRQIMDVGDIDFTDTDFLMQTMQSVMGGNVAILPTVQTLKVYPDGSEVPVLPVSISDFVDSYYRDIVACSEERQAFNLPISPMGNFMGMLGGMMGGGGMGGLVATQQHFMSVVTPALLFEDLTLRSATGSKLRPPLISHPLAN